MRSEIPSWAGLSPAVAVTVFRRNHFFKKAAAKYYFSVLLRSSALRDLPVLLPRFSVPRDLPVLQNPLLCETFQFYGIFCSPRFQYYFLDPLLYKTVQYFECPEKET
ncbi:hypothetical protein RF55_12726 [Lasius niger]|uniref:Uncharacterized protein n=1 Tax=Lasius niger TaxID=67767 RepID=A0A0J7KCB7_LASNI|nr:hypothetical protein RF55_12726 [Lasius niger]